MVRTTRKHAFVSENKQSRLPDSLCRRTRCTSRHFFTRHRHVHVFVSADAFHRLDAHSPRPRVVRKAPTTRHRASTPVLAVLAGDAFASEFQSLLHDTAAQTDTFFVFDYTGSEYRPPGTCRVHGGRIDSSGNPLWYRQGAYDAGDAESNEFVDHVAAAVPPPPRPYRDRVVSHDSCVNHSIGPGRGFGDTFFFSKRSACGWATGRLKRTRITRAVPVQIETVDSTCSGRLENVYP